MKYPMVFAAEPESFGRSFVIHAGPVFRSSAGST
jgi:hypothetical protein